MAYGSVEDLHFDNLSVSGNDEYRTHTSWCTSCNEDGQEVQAVRYCIDCEEYQCGKCSRSHDRYNKGHDVLDESKIKRWGEKKSTKLPTEKCQKHIGEVLQIYCLNHEELCCHVCVAMEHSTCQGKKYIPDLAENITDDEDYQTLDSSTKDLVSHLNEIIKQSTINKANVENVLDRFDQYVKETRERLLDLFDRRTNETRKTVAMERTRVASKIDSTIRRGRELKTEIEQLQSRVDPTKVTNKSQLFINLKNTRTELNKTLKDIEQISRPQPKDISFEFCREIAVLLDKRENAVRLNKHEDPVLLYEQDDPVIQYEQEDSVLLYEQNYPVFLDEQEDLELLDEQEDPVLLDEQEDPVLLDEQEDPVLLDEQIDIVTHTINTWTPNSVPASAFENRRASYYAYDPEFDKRNGRLMKQRMKAKKSKRKKDFFGY